MGIWTVRASDPENGLLSYFVAWGDEVVNAGVPTIMISNSNLQTTTFSHSYPRSGTYYAKFKVSDSSGQSAQTSISVNVTHTGQDITVLSPNGGEQWKAYSTEMIRWGYKNLPSTSKVDIYLQPTMPPCPAGMGCIQVMPERIVLDKNITIGGGYNWIVATDIVNNPIPVGNYYIEICQAGTDTCDLSGQPFTITAQSL